MEVNEKSQKMSKDKRAKQCQYDLCCDERARVPSVALISLSLWLCLCLSLEILCPFQQGRPRDAHTAGSVLRIYGPGVRV